MTLENIKVHGLNEILSSLDSWFHRWAIIDQKRNEFQEHQEDPRLINNLRSEVAESWIRSKKYGISPQSQISNKMMLQPSQFDKVLVDNHKLLEVAVPILEETALLFKWINSFGIALLDRNAILLDLYNYPYQHMKPGLNLSEDRAGTSAVSISLAQNKPAYLLGSEIYNNDLRASKFVFSVPIQDAEGRLVAFFAAPYFQELKNTEEHKRFLFWLVSWQFSLAQKIQENLIQNNRKTYYDLDRSYLETAISLIEEGFIFVDERGYISRISSGTEKLLGIQIDKAKEKYYTELVGEIPFLTEVIENSTSVPKTTAEVVINRNNKSLLIKVKPVFYHHSNQTSGAILYLKAINQNKNNVKEKTLESLYSFDNIIGDSPIMNQTKEIARKLAHASGNILLTGESGTGKELFAHAIHQEYGIDTPFVAINCAAIPEDLIESELFGYEGGSFTGAEKKGRIGKIEMANGGILFLDEIGDMPLNLQPVLLRVLEDKRIMRIGGSKYIPVQVRVLAASNKDLPKMVKQGQFREDLYFRLAALKLQIPPLRNRGQDIIALAKIFIQQTCTDIDLPLLVMDEDVIQCLMDYDWRGNIRELKNCMLWAVTVATGPKIRLHDLPEELLKRPINEENKDLYTFKQKVEALEEENIRDTLNRCNQNISEAARLLGMSRPTLYRKLQAYGLRDQY